MNNFDERQLWIRGDIFKHAFILLVILTVFDYLSANLVEEMHIFGTISGMVNIMITIMVAGIEMIHKDAYEPYFGCSHMAGIVIFVIGFSITFMRCFEIYNGSIHITTMDGREDMGMLIISICLCIYGAYHMKHHYKQKNEVQEDA